MKKLKQWIMLGCLMLMVTACASGEQQPASAERVPTAVVTTPATIAIPATIAPAVTTQPTATPAPGPTLIPEATAATQQESATLFTLASPDPVIDAGDGGDWSQPLHNAGAVLYHEGQFHMFRNGYRSLPGHSVIGYATSPDGINWTHNDSNPVLQTDDVPYAGVMIMASSAIVLDDGTWVLYFLIWDTPQTPGAIGRATAPAPTGPWTPDPAPVLEAGESGDWDSEFVTQPTVLRAADGSGFVMYFTGVDSKNVSRVGLATSQDGIAWTRYDDPATVEPPYATSDPILQPGDPGAWDAAGAARGRVVRTPAGLFMVYRAPASGMGFTYGLASSTDGIQWHKHPANPLLERDDLPGSPGLFFPAFAYHDDALHFFIEAYSGRSQIYLLKATPALVTAGEPLARGAPGEAVVRTLVAELPAATGGLAVDEEGNIYAASIGLAPARNGREIYRISPDGAYELWVESEELNGASGNTFDEQGYLLQSSLRAGTIHRIAPEGTVQKFVAGVLNGPVGITRAEDGTLFVASCGSNSVRRVSAGGEVELFARSSFFRCPNGITLDDSGNLYVANFSDGRVLKITPGGETSEFATLPGGNNGHIYFLDGLLYVVARGAQQIYTLTLDGDMTLLAGTGEAGHDDGPALQATFNLPNDIVASPDGRLLYVNEAFPTDSGANIPSVIRVIELP